MASSFSEKSQDVLSAPSRHAIARGITQQVAKKAFSLLFSLDKPDGFDMSWRKLHSGQLKPGTAGGAQGL